MHHVFEWRSFTKVRYVDRHSRLKRKGKENEGLITI